VREEGGTQLSVTERRGLEEGRAVGGLAAASWAVIGKMGRASGKGAGCGRGKLGFGLDPRAFSISLIIFFLFPKSFSK